MGLEVFQYLDLSDIDSCRVVCHEMRTFVDSVVHKSQALAPKLDLAYKRQRWMCGKPLKELTIDFSCDPEEPDSDHVIDKCFMMKDRLVLVVSVSRTGQHFVLIFDDEGQRIASIKLPGECMVAQLKLGVFTFKWNVPGPGLYWNVFELKGQLVHLPMMQFLKDVKNVDGMVYFKFQIHWKSTVFIAIHHEENMNLTVKRLAISPLYVPDEPMTFNIASKSIILQYPHKRKYILEAFDVETGDRKYMLPGPESTGRGKTNSYLKSYFMTADFAVMCKKRRRLINLDNFQVIEAFRHMTMVDCRRDSGNRVTTFNSAMSNRFAVRLRTSTSPDNPCRWVLWIGDLLNQKERKFKSPGDPSRMGELDIVEDVFLLMIVAGSDPSKSCPTLLKGSVVAYDLCQTDEEKFWASKVELGNGSLGFHTQELVGSLGLLEPCFDMVGSENRKTLLRLPLKGANNRK